MAYRIHVRSRLRAWTVRVRLGRIVMYALALSVSSQPQLFGGEFPDTYSARATYGWVLDKESKQPISGVSVAAVWVLKGGLHFNTTRALHVMEVVTGEDGSFYLPKWGPKRRPGKEILTDRDPVLYLFKAGYYPKGIQNPYGDPNKLGRKNVRTWFKNGDALTLEAFSGDEYRYEWLLDSKLHAVEYLATPTDQCGWKELPRFIIALKREQLRISGSPYHDDYVFDALVDAYNNEPCDASRVFGEFLQ